jgi:hypothetical protein
MAAGITRQDPVAQHLDQTVINLRKPQIRHEASLTSEMKRREPEESR